MSVSDVNGLRLDSVIEDVTNDCLPFAVKVGNFSFSESLSLKLHQKISSVKV